MLGLKLIYVGKMGHWRCVFVSANYVVIRLCNGFSSVRHEAYTRTIIALLSNGPLGTNSRETWIDNFIQENP